MAYEYFGYPAAGADPTGQTPTNYATAYWIKNKNLDWKCPGSGNYNVIGLRGWLYSGGGTHGHFRMALYDHDHARLCQHDAAIGVTSTTPAWITGTSLDTYPVLVGGDSYEIAISWDAAADILQPYNTVTNGDVCYGSTDYTGGFPNPLNDGTDTTRIYSVQCIVEAAAGGATASVTETLNFVEALD